MQEKQETPNSINDLTNLKRVIMQLNRENQQLKATLQQEQLAKIPQEQRILLEMIMELTNQHTNTNQILSQLLETTKTIGDYQNRLFYEIAENIKNLPKVEEIEEIKSENEEKIDEELKKYETDTLDGEKEDEEEQDENIDDLVLRKLNALEKGKSKR